MTNWELFQQPYYNLITRSIVGVEVLTRTQGNYYSLEAINGYKNLESLTSWLLAQLFNHMKNNILCFPLSINVPPQIIDGHFVQRLQALFTKNLLSHLIIEITEDHIENPKRLNHYLQTLRLLGVRVAIDDFGKGYTSMQMLLNLEVDYLKLDKIFIQHEGNRRSQVLEAIVNMAKALNLTVICEGIETEDQWKLAQNCGADIGQGFFMAYPQPLSEKLVIH